MDETIQRVILAMYNAIESTALDANCLSLQNGRIFFDGDFDAEAVARAVIAAAQEPT